MIIVGLSLLAIAAAPGPLRALAICHAPKPAARCAFRATDLPLEFTDTELTIGDSHYRLTERGQIKEMGGGVETTWRSVIPPEQETERDVRVVRFVFKKPTDVFGFTHTHRFTVFVGAGRHQILAIEDKASAPAAALPVAAASPVVASTAARERGLKAIGEPLRAIAFCGGVLYQHDDQPCVPKETKSQLRLTTDALSFRDVLYAFAPDPAIEAQPGALKIVWNVTGVSPRGAPLVQPTKETTVEVVLFESEVPMGRFMGTHNIEIHESRDRPKILHRIVAVRGDGPSENIAVGEGEGGAARGASARIAATRSEMCLLVGKLRCNASDTDTELLWTATSLTVKTKGAKPRAFPLTKVKPLVTPPGAVEHAYTVGGRYDLDNDQVVRIVVYATPEPFLGRTCDAIVSIKDERSSMLTRYCGSLSGAAPD